MAWSFYENDNSSTLIASQNTLIGPTALTDIPGCALTLSVGTWIVICTVQMRIWQTGTAYSKAQFVCQLTDSANTVINGQGYATSVDAQNEQRSEVSHTITTIVRVSSGTYGVKLRGGCTMTVGTNFASGYRWDSGLGGPSVMIATRIG